MSSKSPSLERLYMKDLQAFEEWKESRLKEGGERLEKVALNPVGEYLSDKRIWAYGGTDKNKKPATHGKATVAGITNTLTREGVAYCRSIHTTPQSPRLFDQILRVWCQENKVLYKSAMKDLGQNPGNLHPSEVVSLLNDLRDMKCEVREISTNLYRFNRAQIDGLMTAISTGQYNRNQGPRLSGARARRIEAAQARAAQVAHSATVKARRGRERTTWEQGMARINKGV